MLEELKTIADNTESKHAVMAAKDSDREEYIGPKWLPLRYEPREIVGIGLRGVSSGGMFYKGGGQW